MVTDAEVELKANRARLTKNGKTIELRVLQPQDAVIECYEVENPPAEHDALNEGMTMVGFTVTLNASTSLRLAVHVGQPESKLPQLSPLSEWPR